MIQLPKAEYDLDQDQPSDHQPSNWLENSMSGLGSLVFHMVLFLILAFIQFGSSGLEGDGEDVFIGSLPGSQLDNSQEAQLQAEEVKQESESEILADPLEDVQPPTDSSDSSAISDQFISTPSPSGGGSNNFDLGAVSIGGGASGSGNWDGMIQSLRRNGLDIVIVFDSTGSMMGEIEEVKSQIKRIGNTLTTLIPKSRISICTYRDKNQEDEYLVKGLPLTNDIQKIDLYLSDIYASAGGDLPEAVHEGLKWSVEKNEFRSRARKVILLFGDAPPHAQFRKMCLEIASDFSSQQGGTVSTVTCRSSVHLKEFVEIAQAGGGEAFLTSDTRQIMTQLLVLVFGSKYRDKVIEAFRLLDR